MGLQVVLDLQWEMHVDATVGVAILHAEALQYKKNVVAHFKDLGALVLDIDSPEFLDVKLAEHSARSNEVEILATPWQASNLERFHSNLVVVEPKCFKYLSWVGDFEQSHIAWLKGIANARKIYTPSYLTGGDKHFGRQGRSSDVVVLPWRRFRHQVLDVNEVERVRVSGQVLVSTEEGPYSTAREVAAATWKSVADEIEPGAGATWITGMGGQGPVWPIGFFPSEIWGMWAEEKVASILLPVKSKGLTRFEMMLVGCGVNVGREINVHFGDQVQTIVLGPDLSTYSIAFRTSKFHEEIGFSGYVLDRSLDVRGLGVGIASISINRNAEWSGEFTTWRLGGSSKGGAVLTQGFHSPEGWGIWASRSETSVYLPVTVSGRLQVILTLEGRGVNIGRAVTIRFGEQEFQVFMEEHFRSHVFDLDLQQGLDQIQFSGYEIDFDVDPRGIGVGISAISIMRPQSPGVTVDMANSTAPNLDGSALVGFHEVEDWGSWTSQTPAVILLPSEISGPITIELGLIGCGINDHKIVNVSMGSEVRSVVLGVEARVNKLQFYPACATNKIVLSGYELEFALEPRRLGVGVTSVRVHRHVSVLRKALNGLAHRRMAFRNDMSEKDAIREKEPQGQPSLLKSGFQVRAITWIRSIDLLHDNWLEIPKGFVEAFRENDDVILTIICPSEWATRLYPDVATFVTRIQPHVCAVRFVFLESDERSWAKFFTEVNLVITPRPDEPGMIFEGFLSEGNSAHFEHIAVGSRALPAQLVGWEKSPIVLQSVHRIDELVEGLRMSREKLLAWDYVKRVAVVATPAGVRATERS